LSHALPRPTLGVDAVDGPRRGYGSGGLGNADRGIGTERLERRAALDGARGCPGAQRRGGVPHPESGRRPAAARQPRAGRSRPWQLRLRRPGHGCAEPLPLRRSGSRNRRPRDTAVASVAPGTLPNADGAEQERMNPWSWACIPVVARSRCDRGSGQFGLWRREIANSVAGVTATAGPPEAGCSGGTAVAATPATKGPGARTPIAAPGRGPAAQTRT